MKLSYRKSVGAFLINKNKQVFIANRINFSNAWQLPQGGIEKDENPKIAILRELLEEIGTNNVEFLNRTPEYNYEYPSYIDLSKFKYPHIGQTIIWFALLFKGKDNDINLNFSKNPEFSEWKWENPDKIVELVVDFKKDMYNKIISYMKLSNII